MLNSIVYKIITGWITSGNVLAVWCGTPCSSWSRARHGPPGSGWCAIRSHDYIYGLPDLSVKAQHTVDLGNKLMRVTARILALCKRMSIPAFLENPASSMLWVSPPIAKFVSSGGHMIVYDACQFGSRWRKRTQVLSICALDGTHISRLCKGRGGFCSNSNKPHIALKGVAPISKRLWTKVAEPYPKQLCYMFAQHIVNCVLKKRMSAMHKLVCC